MAEMSVAERIRYFESRRSGNVYIVGHGQLLVRKATFNYKARAKGKLRQRSDEFVTGIDTGGLGSSIGDVGFRLDKHGKPGSFQDDHLKFTVPNNMKILFYCPHGEELQNAIARLIEGFAHGQRPPAPTETIPGGAKCYNYRLSYPHHLALNLTRLRARHDVIMLSETRGDAYVPLSTILRDPRCQNATIHWVACRSLIERRLNARNEKLDDFDVNFIDYVGGEPLFKFDRPATFEPG